MVPHHIMTASILHTKKSLDLHAASRRRLTICQKKL